MMDRREMLRGSAMAMGFAALTACGFRSGSAQAKDYPYKLTDAQWQQKLTSGQYAVLRRAATEAPFTSPLNKEHRKGIFACAGCDQKLFSSATKYDSGTGWPSFWRPLPGGVGTSTDYVIGYARTEVHCARCGGHLGHVFDDGPQPTGKRYCMKIGRAHV